MPALYRNLIRPWLFLQDSEGIHNRTLAMLGRAAHSPALGKLVAKVYQPEPLPVRLFNLDFPNPVGLAAGMDKQAAAVPIWESLGFGFSELGGVTCHAQPGNPTPRMFRCVPDEALVNRMGFNNPGATAFAERLKQWHASGHWPAHPVGVNLGKSKITPLEAAAQDYADSLRLLWPLADFFVVNVSSPNTPNLRQLQDKAALDEILSELQRVQQKVADTHNATLPAHQRQPLKPILVKVAPDLSFEALDEIVGLCGPRNVAGIVATNTTITRPQSMDLARQKTYAEMGGLSGRPLRPRSTEVIRHLYRQTSGALPIIGVGGIFNTEDAWEKITGGATLVQIYSGLVYEGPGIVKEIVDGLRGKLAERGLKSIDQAVGIGNGRP